MKLIYKEKYLPDGRVTYYHRVDSLNFNTDNTVLVVIGSWRTAERATSLSVPDGTSAILLTYETMEQAQENILEKVVATTEWNDGVIVDTGPSGVPAESVYTIRIQPLSPSEL